LENAILEFYQQFACVGGDPLFSESLWKGKELQKKFLPIPKEIFSPLM
jgi:DNA-directed RNA polymerase subunit beta